MSQSPTPRRADDAASDDTTDDDFDAPENEGADALEEETGIDLNDASELDADNVPADEENDRVMQAPD